MIAFADKFFRSEVLASDTSAEASTNASRSRSVVRSRERVRFNPSGAMAAASVISMLVAAQVSMETMPVKNASAGFTQELGTLVLKTKEPSAVAKKAAAIWNSPRSPNKQGRPIGELLEAIRSSIT